MQTKLHKNMQGNKLKFKIFKYISFWKIIEFVWNQCQCHVFSSDKGTYLTKKPYTRKF